MRLIVGGYAQGRLFYAVQKYHLTASDVWDASDTDSEWNGHKVIYHFEALVTDWIHTGKDPCHIVLEMMPQWKDCILITQEVGCGLVPVSPEDRAWRDAVGKVNTLLAMHAESVERVCCGIGMHLKNDVGDGI